MDEAARDASELIDRRIDELGDWRGDLLASIRDVIRNADPDIIEEVKWRKPTNPLGVAVWSHGGIVCTGETYKDKVKLTFAKGASLKDPAGVFNASLDGNVRRAIDFQGAGELDEGALATLIVEAIAFNEATSGPS